MDKQDSGTKVGDGGEPVSVKGPGPSRVYVVNVRTGAPHEILLTPTMFDDTPGLVVITLREGSPMQVEVTPAKDTDPPGFVVVVMKDGAIMGVIQHPMKEGNASGLVLVTMMDGKPVEVKVERLEEGNASGFVDVCLRDGGLPKVAFRSMKKSDVLQSLNASKMDGGNGVGSSKDAVHPSSSSKGEKGNLVVGAMNDEVNRTPRGTEGEEGGVVLDATREMNSSIILANEQAMSTALDAVKLDDHSTAMEQMGSSSVESSRENQDGSVVDAPATVLELVVNDPRLIAEEDIYDVIGMNDESVEVDGPNFREVFRELGEKAIIPIVEAEDDLGENVDGEVQGPSNVPIQDAPQVRDAPAVRDAPLVQGNEVAIIHPWLDQAFAHHVRRANQGEFPILPVTELHPLVNFPTPTGRDNGVPPYMYRTMSTIDPDIVPRGDSYVISLTFMRSLAGGVLGRGGSRVKAMTRVPGMGNVQLDDPIGNHRTIHWDSPTIEGVMNGWYFLMDEFRCQANWHFGYPHFNRGARSLTPHDFGVRIPITALNVGRFLGDNGRTIRETEDASRAMVVIRQDTPFNNEDTHIFAYGTVDQVRLARQLILQRGPQDP